VGVVQARKQWVCVLQCQKFPPTLGPNAGHRRLEPIEGTGFSLCDLTPSELCRLQVRVAGNVIHLESTDKPSVRAGSVVGQGVIVSHVEGIQQNVGRVNRRRTDGRNAGRRPTGPAVGRSRTEPVELVVGSVGFPRIVASCYFARLIDCNRGLVLVSASAVGQLFDVGVDADG